MHSSARSRCGGLHVSPFLLVASVLLVMALIPWKGLDAAALASVKSYAPSYEPGVAHVQTFHVPEKEEPTEYIEDNSELSKAGAHNSKKVLILGTGKDYAQSKTNYGSGYASTYGSGQLNNYGAHGVGYESPYGARSNSKAYNAFYNYGYTPSAKSSYGTYSEPVVGYNTYGYGQELLHDLTHHASEFGQSHLLHEHEPFEFYDNGKFHDHGAYNAKKSKATPNYFSGYQAIGHDFHHQLEHAPSVFDEPDQVKFVDLAKYGHAAFGGYAENTFSKAAGKKISLPKGSPGYGFYSVFGGYMPQLGHHDNYGYDKLFENTYDNHDIHEHLPTKQNDYGYGGVKQYGGKYDLAGHHGAEYIGDHGPIGGNDYGYKLRTGDKALGGYNHDHGKAEKPFNSYGTYNSYYGGLDFHDNHGHDNDYASYYKLHLSYGPLQHQELHANKKADFYGHFINPKNWGSYRI